MKKRIPILVTGALCAVSLVVGVSASNIIQRVESELRPDFNIIIDGQQRTFTNAQGEVVYPLLYEGTTYLPVRAIGELMGKTVYWYEDTKTIELKDDTTTVTDADVIVPGSSGGGGTVATPAPDQQAATITEEEAKAIALQDAGVAASDVSFTKVERDRDDRMQVYDVEFYVGRTEYSYEIRISDGQIVDKDIDYD